MGRQKKSGTDGEVRIGLKIRYEIINMIYRNPAMSVKIPTSMELAQHFGVARCTVTDELKKLADEGLITGKRGIGTFTNPDVLRGASHMPGRRVVGILVGDSWMFCQDYTNWVLASAVGTALLPDIGHPRNIVLTEHAPELIAKELHLLNLDGIVWILPPQKMAPYLKHLREGGMPVVTVYQNIPGVPGIELDFKKQGRDIAEFLLQEDKTNVVWGAFDPWSADTQREAEKILTTRRGGDVNSLVWTNPGEYESKLESLLESASRIDAIYAHGEFVFPIINLLRKYGTDPFRDCLLIASYGEIRKMPEFKGIVRHAPLEEMGEKAVELLVEQFRHGTGGKASHFKVNFKLERRK